MEASRAADALARASAALVREPDVAGFLAALLTSCIDVLRVDAAGILVDDRGRLDVLAASSHDTIELDLHASQVEEGPCFDAHVGGKPVSARAPDLVTTWPRFGPVMVDAGFASVHAAPLRWHGDSLGSMGIFRRTFDVFIAEERIVAQAFADLATLLIVQTEKVDLDDLRLRVQHLLTTRVVLEQAKGVLTETEGVDMAEAYQILLRRAASTDAALGTTARAVLLGAQGSIT